MYCVTQIRIDLSIYFLAGTKRNRSDRITICHHVSKRFLPVLSHTADPCPSRLQTSIQMSFFSAATSTTLRWGASSDFRGSCRPERFGCIERLIGNGRCHRCLADLLTLPRLILTSTAFAEANGLFLVTTWNDFLNRAKWYLIIYDSYLSVHVAVSFSARSCVTVNDTSVHFYADICVLMPICNRCNSLV